MESHRERLDQLVHLYVSVKDLILKAEELDARLESNIAVIKEQRDALDHVMRFLGRCFDADVGSDYLNIQLDKASGHLYRAAYDSLDGIVVSVLSRIQDDYLHDIPLETIREVMPEYWKEHRPRLDTIRLRAAEHRTKKDIGEISEQAMDDYKEDVFELLYIGIAIRDKQASLVEHRDCAKAEAAANARRERVEVAQARRSDWLARYLIPILAALLGALTTWLLT